VKALLENICRRLAERRARRQGGLDVMTWLDRLWR
jgi:hypothetical protein